MFEGSVQTRTTPFSSTIQIGNPVAYKLVRVAGDGRLVPATDEEILEVNENDMQILSDTGHTVGYVPVEGLASELPRLESPEGLLQSDNMEERLHRINESHMPSILVDINIQCFNENNLFEEDQVLRETLLQEPIPSSSNVESESNTDQSNKVESCSNAAASPKDTALSGAAGKPDFSRVRGEICLENLSIKALQETFRATFGRETNVKDKLWLKRRIAMGLINSCDVPTTIPTIKDNKIFESQENSNDVTNVDMDMADGIRTTNQTAVPSSPDHINGQSDAPGHSPSDHFGDQYCRNDDFSCEHNRAAKRVRKPTRRYIEELSETDEKQQNDKSTIPSKGRMLSEKSEVRSISVSSGRRVVTRMVSLAGSRIQVPYVCHVRKSRPRENVMALMECHSSCLKVKSSPARSNLNLTPSQLNSEVVNQISVVKSDSGAVQKESFATCHLNNNDPILTEVDQDMEPGHIESAGNSSDDNHVSLPITQGALRRKHHRAWTLSEVTKLVDGVSMFGAGKWSEIRKLSFSSYSYRTSVDLKDKWRNLLKASASKSPSSSMGNLKKHGSMHIPMQILIRVRELAEKQSLAPPVVNKVAGDNNNRGNE